MRTQHSGHGSRKTVKLRSTKRPGQKTHLLGDGSEQRPAQDHRNKNTEQPHARMPVSSPRTTSKLRSAGPAEAGLQQARRSPEVAGTPTPAKCFPVLPDQKRDSLLLSSRPRPASRQQILVFGPGGPAYLTPWPGGPQGASTSARLAHFRLRGTNQSAAAVFPVLASGPRLAPGGLGPFGHQGLVSNPPEVLGDAPLGALARRPVFCPARKNAQWLGI